MGSSRREPRKPCILLPIYIGIFDLVMYVYQVRNYSISARLYTYWEGTCKHEPFSLSCNDYPQCHTWTSGVYKECDVSPPECQCVAGSRLYYPPIALVLCLIVTFIYDIFDKLVPLINLWKMNFKRRSLAQQVDIDEDEEKELEFEQEPDYENIHNKLDKEFSKNKISSLSNSFLFLFLIFMNRYLFRFCIDEYYHKKLFFKYQRHHIIYYSIRYIPYCIITMYLYLKFNQIDQGIIIYWYDMLPMTGLLIINEFIKIIYRISKPYEKTEHVAFVLDDYFGPHLASLINEYLYDVQQGNVSVNCNLIHDDNQTDDEESSHHHKMVGYYHKKLELAPVDSNSVAAPIVSRLQ